MIELWWLLPCTFILAGLGAGVLRRMALKHDLLDIPNERSSHTVPTPRGGGLAIVGASTLGFILLALIDVLDLRLLLSLTVGGMAVAAIGWLDDRFRLSAKMRLLVHFGAAAWALGCLGGLPPLEVAGHVVPLGGFGVVLGVLGIVWVLNLFNFMDGIDGIAGSEAVFIAVAAGFLGVGLGVSQGVTVAGWVFAAACLGFLIWNWPPAKLFMGDVGSGYLGYTLVVLAIAASRDHPVATLIWLILGGVFFIDATVTLACRVCRGEPVYQAHRSHAYQHLTQRWGKHGYVTLAVVAINLFWLLPWAWLASVRPSNAIWIVLIALVPIVFVVAVIGVSQAGTLKDKARQ